MDKDVKRLLKALEDAGFRIEHGGKHWKVKASEGNGFVTIATTPSGRRWLEQTLSQLNRIGFDVDAFKGRAPRRRE